MGMVAGCFCFYCCNYFLGSVTVRRLFCYKRNFDFCLLLIYVSCSLAMVEEAADIKSNLFLASGDRTEPMVEY